MTSLRTRLFRLLVAAGATLLVAACGPDNARKGELRFVTEEFSVRISPNKLPTRALEPVYWRVVVHERKTGTPVQGGQGRMFATSKDRKSIANGLEETDELGTYRTNLMFVTAGMWAMAVQFRRDSTLPLQRTQDWTQQILSAEEPGDFSPPASIEVDTTAPATKGVDPKKPKAN